MKYNWTENFKKIWDNASQRYNEGERAPEKLLTEEEKVFIESIGQNPQEIFDYVDDSIRYEDGPTFENVLAVAQVRLSYFENIQNSRPSTHQLDPNSLPSKKETIKGILWLPRLIEKAKSKLKGELHPDVMYGCAGDRKFFKEHDIHPASILEVTKMHLDNTDAIVDWFIQTKKKQS